MIYKKSAWNRGYATEGALRCLQFAKKILHLSSLISVASQTNLASIAVMKKIKMKELGLFSHPKLIEYESLSPCVCYHIDL